MILVVEDDWAYIAAYKASFSILRQQEGKDYIFAKSFEEARRIFWEQGSDITGMIVDHKIEGRETGADIINAVRSNPAYDHIKIVRCASFPENHLYPESIPFFRRTSSLREAVASVCDGHTHIHPCVRYK